ncbi:heme ABC transporter ATP-binding protein [Allopusillimonas ginsengisoli]|nr:heme ABC transporter ATP-binding protein [Allopusillimonas ginsengisoli]TEA78747.1 heme ABC transporter ATP-binding protein [Allopusillimonas ginsengisoli]
MRGQRMVLQNTSLVLKPGELLTLLGANGAGKSTLLSVLAGEIRLPQGAEGGQPFLNGKRLQALRAGEQARTRAMLPQRSGLAFDLEVAEVVAMGAYPFPELATIQVDALVEQALARADVAYLANRRYLELSGGEQQRVHFARVMLQVLAGRSEDPHGRYLLLDEPTASLDPLHQQGLLKAVSELARLERIGVLLILHDINLAALWSDRIALLADGTIFACDAPDKALTPANLRQVYGMDVHVMPHPYHAGKPLVVFG